MHHRLDLTLRLPSTEHDRVRDCSQTLPGRRRHQTQLIEGRHHANSDGSRGSVPYLGGHAQPVPDRHTETSLSTVFGGGVHPRGDMARRLAGVAGQSRVPVHRLPGRGKSRLAGQYRIGRGHRADGAPESRDSAPIDPDRTVPDTKHVVHRRRDPLLQRVMRIQVGGYGPTGGNASPHHGGMFARTVVPDRQGPLMAGRNQPALSALAKRPCRRTPQGRLVETYLGEHGAYNGYMNRLTPVTRACQSHLLCRQSCPRFLGDGGLKRLGRRPQKEGALNIPGRGHQAAIIVDGTDGSIVGRFNQPVANDTSQHRETDSADRKFVRVDLPLLVPPHDLRLNRVEHLLYCFAAGRDLLLGFGQHLLNLGELIGFTLGQS